MHEACEGSYYLLRLFGFYIIHLLFLFKEVGFYVLCMFFSPARVAFSSPSQCLTFLHHLDDQFTIWNVEGEFPYLNSHAKSLAENVKHYGISALVLCVVGGGTTQKEASGGSKLEDGYNNKLSDN